MKKIISIVFCVVFLMVSCFSMSASAAETTNTDCIYFKVPDGSGYAWNNFKMIFCHIWAEGEEGGDFHPWQAKAERCTDLGNGYWSYDISGFTFDKEKSYSVIFSNENGMQTYNLTLTSACRGDIAECNGDFCENPVDSEKQCTVARWVNNGDTVHPSIQVSSQGTMLDPDNAGSTGIDIRFGDSEGEVVEYEPVEIATEEETEPETEPETEEKTEESTKAEKTEVESDDDKKDNDDDKEKTDFTMWIIIGVVAGVLVVAAVVVFIFIKRKK